MRLCSPPTSPPGFSALSVSFSPKTRPSHTRSLHGQSELPQVLGRCRTRARRSRSPLPATAFNTRLACRARVVHPDGAGLPVGSGTPAEGAKIYVAKCALMSWGLWGVSRADPSGAGSGTSPAVDTAASSCSAIRAAGNAAVEDRRVHGPPSEICSPTVLKRPFGDFRVTSALNATASLHWRSKARPRPGPRPLCGSSTAHEYNCARAASVPRGATGRRMAWRG